MPRAFSENERSMIKKALKESALDCLVLYGVKKTTVDELVKRAKIPKGTYYLFYSSKEALLLDALNDVHDKIQTTLLQELHTMEKECITADTITDMIIKFFKMADESNLIQLLINGDLELLMRRLTDEDVHRHFVQDKFSFSQFARFIPHADGKPLCAYEASLRAIFLTMIFKREIGGESYYDAVRLLVRGLVVQLMEPSP